MIKVAPTKLFSSKERKNFNFIQVYLLKLILKKSLLYDNLLLTTIIKKF